MELFTWWPVVVVFGVVALFAFLQSKFPILNPRRWNDRPTHYSETDEGQGRHEERMQGLRAMAEDIKARETEPASPAEEVREQAVEQPDEESVHW